MSSVSQYFKGLFGGIASLLTGMSVTLKELFTKKITQQYPENRDTLVISDRFKAELYMPHDENNEHACTACGICQMNCPNGTIKVLSKTIETEEGKKKKVLEAHMYDLGMCTFCNLCVITCPQDAIKFSNNFENALFTRSKLRLKLNHEGSKLREKKKEAPATKTAAPAAEKPENPKPEVIETKPSEIVKPTDDVQKPIVDNNASASSDAPTEVKE